MYLSKVGMYAGEVVEEGSVIEVLKSRHHPYALGLLNSVPRPDRDSEGKLSAIPGLVPDIGDMPSFISVAHLPNPGAAMWPFPNNGQRRMRCVY